eukprot:5881446-Amphidinium_carterae.1
MHNLQRAVSSIAGRKLSEAAMSSHQAQPRCQKSTGGATVHTSEASGASSKGCRFGASLVFRQKRTLIRC